LVGLMPYSTSILLLSPSMVIAMRPTMSAPPRKQNFIFIGLHLVRDDEGPERRSGGVRRSPISSAGATRVRTAFGYVIRARRILL